MTHILKNRNLEILIDLYGEDYTSLRFNWAGKIVKVKFQRYLNQFTQ